MRLIKSVRWPTTEPKYNALMPIHFINNYPKHSLESRICKADGTPLYGELWVYRELLKFSDNDFLGEDLWIVKHCYNLSSHPSSIGKAEGEIDFLILSPMGILLLEVKGGAIEVDAQGVYYSSAKGRDRYEAENPFVQSREYLHSLKRLLNSSPFIYRAVIFPHEKRFRLEGPELSGYRHLFFSGNELDTMQTEFGRNQLFYDFLQNLSKASRKRILANENPPTPAHKLETAIWKRFPLLNANEIHRLRAELFPKQRSYGFDPERVKSELLLNENFEILKGLRKNRSVMVEGGPGTGKTVLATKFLAEHLIKQHKGVYFCANLLLRAKMEHMLLHEYKLDANLVSFKVFHPQDAMAHIPKDTDFVIIDEAQEFFEHGLCDFIDRLEAHLSKPRLLILYDTEQSILSDHAELGWYADYLLEQGFSHYLFDKTWRCAQDGRISEFAVLLARGQYKKLEKSFHGNIQHLETEVDKIAAINKIWTENQDRLDACIVLIESNLIEEFRAIAKDYLGLKTEELSAHNINIKNNKLRYTTPLKYRGLEQKNVFLITPSLGASSRVQNYVGATRAMHELKTYLWKSN
jgi:hypothetical protein